MEYKISPSSISKFENRSLCKRKLIREIVYREIPRDPPSDQMKKGNLFEYLAIGANVTGEEKPDDEFMMNKKGESIEYARLKQQAERVANMLNPDSDEFIGISKDMVQVKLENDKMKGVIDVLSFKGKDTILDLKFTADVDATYGDYAWGRDVSEIDWTQNAFYKILFRDNKVNSGDAETANLVCDASPRMGIKLFNVKLSSDYLYDVTERADIVHSFVNKVIQGDINEKLKVSPSEKNCEGCPLECEFRYKSPKIKKINVFV